MIYLRRIDLPKETLHVADENLRGIFQNEMSKIHYYHNSEYWDEMAKKYPAQVNERELFLTKQTETISATQVGIKRFI